MGKYLSENTISLGAKSKKKKQLFKIFFKLSLPPAPRVAL